jgi:hypothetical protein
MSDNLCESPGEHPYQSDGHATVTVVVHAATLLAVAGPAWAETRAPSTATISRATVAS